MTRETKLGLVVAGSFLALVGGVVVARLKQVDMPGEGTEAAEKPAATAPDSPTLPPEPEKKAIPVSSEAVARAGDKKMPAGSPEPGPAAAPPPDTPPPQPTTSTPPAAPPMEPVAAPPGANASGSALPPPMTPLMEPVPPPAVEPKPAEPPKEEKPAP